MTHRIRRSARILLLDDADRLLLFRFTPDGMPPFWATVGGEADPGESFAAAARRELFEETGIVADPGREIASRAPEFVTIEGEPVRGDERFFVVRTAARDIDMRGHTALEQQVMTVHRWWTCAELAATTETVYPADLVDMLDAVARTAVGQ